MAGWQGFLGHQPRVCAGAVRAVPPGSLVGRCRNARAVRAMVAAGGWRRRIGRRRGNSAARRRLGGQSRAVDPPLRPSRRAHRSARRGARPAIRRSTRSATASPTRICAGFPPTSSRRRSPTTRRTWPIWSRRFVDVYCSTTGYDYAHVFVPEERQWLRQAAETGRFRAPADPIDPVALLDRLTQVEAFERFLHRTFPGKTRFSIEGLDMLVPILDEVIGEAGEAGVAPS